MESVCDRSFQVTFRVGRDALHDCVFLYVQSFFAPIPEITMTSACQNPHSLKCTRCPMGKFSGTAFFGKFSFCGSNKEPRQDPNGQRRFGGGESTRGGYGSFKSQMRPPKGSGSAGDLQRATLQHVQHYARARFQTSWMKTGTSQSRKQVSDPITEATL